MLSVKLLRDDSKPPARMSAGAAGYDIFLCTDAPLVVPALGRALAPSGLAVAIPTGTYGRIAPRSGLAVREGLGVGAGVVDADFRGEVMVLLLNHSDGEVTLQPGDRIAQLILECIVTPPIQIADQLPTTTRGDGGFGSTGH